MNSNRTTTQEAGSISSSRLERVKTRDAEAWQRFCRMYGPLVYTWARRAGLQDPDAADVGQEVFRTVADRIADFRRERPDDTFRGWLWTITRNKIRDHFRAGVNRPETVGGTELQQQLAQLPQSEPSSSDGSGDEPAEVALVHRAMEAVRGEFEDSTWQCFWRMTVDGHTSAEIAAELGMARSAVRQAKYRVLRRLREELK